MIRHLLLVFALMSLLQIARSQVKIQDVKRETSLQIRPQFDSTKNFLHENVESYIGQTLWLKPKKEEFQKFGYANFYIEKGVNLYSKTYFQPTKHSSVTPHDSIANHVFYVKDVYKQKHHLYPTRDIYMLELEDKKRGNFVFYLYDTNDEHQFPFIVNGYVENLKEKFLHAKYYQKFSPFTKEWKPLYTYVLDSDEIRSKVGTIWVIEDITLDNEYFNLSFQLKNSTGERVLQSISSFDESKFIPKSEGDRLIKKYGLKRFTESLQGDTYIGMPSELTLIAMGKPKKINRSTNSSVDEQWVYDYETYLYFTNGKLTTIQD